MQMIALMEIMNISGTVRDIKNCHKIDPLKDGSFTFA